MPAQMTLALAPTSVPLPPKQGPKARAQTNGVNGRCKVGVSDRDITTFTIIVVTGIESTNAEVRAEIHKIIIMATAKRDSAETDMITFSVSFPIHAMNPRRSIPSISTNIAAKKRSVGHSTLDRT